MLRKSLVTKKSKAPPAAAIIALASTFLLRHNNVGAFQARLPDSKRLKMGTMNRRVLRSKLCSRRCDMRY